MSQFSEFMLSTGYECQTTFWDDFSIADRFGMEAVQDTYDRAFIEWRHNHIYLTELVMVLNHKSWQYCKTVPSLSVLYVRLYEEANNYALRNLKGKELAYYINTTD